MSSDTSAASSKYVHCDPAIRRASRTDIPVLAALLGRSLYRDPLCKWIFPSHKRRIKNVTRDFTRLMKPRVKHGIVATVDCLSVAVWTPPNPPQQTWRERYQESLYMRLTHGRRVHEVRDCLHKMAKRHPLSPHWYLLALATDDDCRGQGMASRLLEDMVGHCDKVSEQIALETSQESNLAFYERFGFVVVDELEVAEDIRTWLMCR